LDELRISNVVRSPAWIKLSYENQRWDQKLVSHPVKTGCVGKFEVTAPAAEVREAELASLSATADCAMHTAWDLVDGSSEILQNGVGTSLSWTAPRVAGDTSFVFRFKADMPSGPKSEDLTVTVRENIPDPQFVFNPPLPSGSAWNGKDDILFMPVVTNLAGFQGAPEPYNGINYEFILSGARAYAHFLENGFVLHHAYENGTVTMDVCLDNGGEKTCRSTSLEVTLPPSVPQPPDKTPDGRLKVFILAGQSNMEGKGVPFGKTGSLDWLLARDEFKDEFKHLVDNNGEALVFEDVWVCYPRESNKTYELYELDTGPLSANLFGDSSSIGPELGIGIQLRNYYEDQVLLVKTCWGGHSLGGHFRPPGAQGKLGTSYVRMKEILKEVLENLKTHFPAYDGKGYDISGLFWHQGYNDQFSETNRAEYAENLAILIDDLRRELGVPRMPLSIGESGMLCGNQEHEICTAQALVPTFAGFEGNVAFSPTRQFYLDSMGDGAGYHWFGSFWSYYKVGDAMGKAMVEMLGNSVGVGGSDVPTMGKPEITVLADRNLITLPDKAEYQLSLYNLQGRIRKKNAVRGTFTLMKKDWPIGMYTLVITGSRTSAVRRLVLGM